MYRIREGMIAWIFHRVTGVGILVFLTLHIVGPKIYGSVLPIALLAMLIFHTLNGIRILLIDFWEKGTKHQRALFYGELFLFFAFFLPASYLMISPIR